MVAPYKLPSANSFYYSLRFAIRYIVSNKKNECDDKSLKLEIKNDKPFDSLLQIKENFDNQCFMVNCILNNHSLFLRMYKLKDKFRYLTIKNTNKNNIVTEISSCIIEHLTVSVT